ncbi:MAG: hypothetical protein IIT65_05950 [Lachnospiraceae bacterium]|nr:hypothetical protein [Eubacterium sp.]MBQ5474235.1 hypothetical protein [Lachnospiraceae bacterium]
MVVKDSLNNAVNNQCLFPISIDKELEDKFIKKAKKSAVALIPASIVVVIVISVLIYLCFTYLGRVRIGGFLVICYFFPFYAVYNLFSTFKAIKKHDYQFFAGEILGKTENNNYVVRGLEDQKIAVLFGKKEYRQGERTIVARLKDDLNLISAD